MTQDLQAYGSLREGILEFPVEVRQQTVGCMDFKTGTMTNLSPPVQKTNCIAEPLLLFLPCIGAQLQPEFSSWTGLK